MSIPKHEIVCGIYKITSPSGRVYIGQSIDIYETWRVRYINKRTLNCQHILISSLNKYGRENHKFEIIEVCSEKHLNYYEIYYIWIYNSFNSGYGMNLTMGGGGIKGLKHTVDTKKRISQNSKGLQNCLGKKYTQEHKDNIRNGNLGKKRTKEFSERLRQINLGKKHSEETKAKIKKIVNEPAYRQRMQSYRIGAVRTLEAREKMGINKRKLILNTQTGIFYHGLKSAAQTIDTNHKYLGKKLSGHHRNNTSFIYV